MTNPYSKLLKIVSDGVHYISIFNITQNCTNCKSIPLYRNVCYAEIRPTAHLVMATITEQANKVRTTMLVVPDSN